MRPDTSSADRNPLARVLRHHRGRDCSGGHGARHEGAAVAGAVGRRAARCDRIRALQIATLSPESYDIIEAGTVREATALVTRERPSLVLLDAVLPDATGYELC